MLFGEKSSIVVGEEYPLGYFAAEAMELDAAVFEKLKKWFLAIGAYDTVYCQRVAPGETARTCRQVGAHRKEREKNGKDFAYREYARAYNRLKTWKQRGKISAEEWNRRVAYIQEVKTEFLAGDISDVEYIAKLNQV